METTRRCVQHLGLQGECTAAGLARAILQGTRELYSYAHGDNTPGHEGCDRRYARPAPPVGTRGLYAWADELRRNPVDTNGQPQVTQ